MKILVTTKYRKQRVAPCHLRCLSKTTLIQLLVQVDQIDDPPVVLVNRRQVDKVLKVDHIDVGFTFSSQNGRVNQE